MSLSKSLKIARQEAKISDVFPITHLNTPSIFESHHGLLGAVIRIQGVAFNIEEPESLNHQSFLLHQALIGLDERFIIYVTTHRKKAICDLTGMRLGNYLHPLSGKKL
jgi:type IV secretion system protein VirB4